MNVDTNWLESEGGIESATVEPGIEPRVADPTVRRRVDVTGLDLTAIRRLVREDLETDRVSLERCGARTYLLLAA
ncbi:hypothetical protein [Natrialbaceae archaeon AArc-T1-2]|uniref:hypothetical protein n=1 Tax=Natrialbaceae archaeon AArc-T1-2 TaxID=3053904 RepID=UPI00255A7AE6|nr:hypothetical protein [Natrialbaceae archaeon AArc-T1-2]WIV68044.1 hypothetical protein QQ977_04750 [Natrialbaceae archaeon AArc-T1-2]